MLTSVPVTAIPARPIAATSTPNTRRIIWKPGKKLKSASSLAPTSPAARAVGRAPIRWHALEVPYLAVVFLFRVRRLDDFWPTEIACSNWRDPALAEAGRQASLRKPGNWLHLNYRMRVNQDDEVVKATFEISRSAKKRLADLKNDLKYVRSVPATEKSIVETLIEQADLAVLAQALRRKAKRAR